MLLSVAIVNVPLDNELCIQEVTQQQHIASIDFTGADIEAECLETEDSHKHKCTAGDHPLLPWKAEHDTFLLELLWHDGWGDYINLCKWTGSSFAALSLKWLGLQTQSTQLLHAAWFPATMSEPQTAATFQILEQYHLLSFEFKASSHEFYHAHKDWYEAFLQMV
ncbi:uncharacterized protein BJ212DRAFT_1305325 [Suillus subaureus]|uniref:CxC2-like cysteine cluster KDZ transposase-associated domain-containing protein n=1 Tax=Suillus subaureus TaxID=48587 RepID=A0A9P7J2J4_9AGAM|nr:uncharacterized protein BJ212DRAFT_1305325 [Suillus subaureus]KAG1800140.1 hypothetical protein BJ212DRAFT_1305325 [Suillus subaureus]